METPRQPFLAAGGRSIALPAYFPSVSGAKSVGAPVDFVKVLAAVQHPLFLVSAFDIAKTPKSQAAELRRSLEAAAGAGAAILLDSGNYEKYWLRSRSWSVESLRPVLQQGLHHLAFCYDETDLPGDATALAAAVEAAVLRDQDASSSGSVCPIVHARSPEAMPQLARMVAQRLHPILLAVPERELGDGLLARAATIAKIRCELDQLGEYIPLHVLGTGNPLSILVFSVSGADSFDGLEWCQTVVDCSNGLLHHFQQRELLGNQTPFDTSSSLSYMEATLAHNLFFYRHWMQTIQAELRRDEAPTLMKQYLSADFVDRLSKQLRSIQGDLYRDA